MNDNSENSNLSLILTAAMLRDANIPFSPTATLNDLLEIFKKFGKRSVCQYQFRKGDIVWICRQCQKDDTCVLCNSCFQNSRHDGHEVFFYHSGAAGCCDCGDECAWAPSGFCRDHSSANRSCGRNLPEEVEAACAVRIKNSVSRIFSYIFIHAEIMQLWNSSECPMLTEEQYLVVYRGDEFAFNDLSSIISLSLNLPREQGDLFARHFLKEGVLVLRKSEDVTVEAFATIVDVFKRFRFKYCLMTGEMLEQEGEIIGILKWISLVSSTSDDMCELIGQQFDLMDMVNFLFTLDQFQSIPVQSALHDLLVNLMSIKEFKAKCASAYALSYLSIAKTHGACFGCTEHSVYTIAVQYLNRENFVLQITKQHNFMVNICEALQIILRCAIGENVSMLRHPVFETRKYNPVLADLKVMFTSPLVARVFASEALPRWLDILEFLQFLHLQPRAVDRHVEYETKDWTSAFNAYLGFSSVFDLMVAWMASPEATTITECDYDAIISVSPEGGSQDRIKRPLMSTKEFLDAVMTRISVWQETHFDMQQVHLDAGPSGSIQLFSVPFNTPSFHIILHRFFSAAIQECLRHSHQSESILFAQLALSANPKFLSLLLDFILVPLVFTAEIESRYWNRNGSIMNDQVANYSKSPYCRANRDLDLLLVQLCSSVMPGDEFVAQLLHRFGVYYYTLSRDGFSMKTSKFGINISDRLDDINRNMIAQAMTLLLHVLTELPPAPGPSTERMAATVRRELIHTLASGPATYSTLQDAIAHLPDHKHFPTAWLNDIINDVSETRDFGVSEPAKRVLKQECWLEYDPTFFRISSVHHQQAMDFRPKITEMQPMVCTLPTPHAAFSAVRLGICSSLILVELVRSQVILHAASMLRSKDTYKAVREIPLQSTSAIFSLSLQILTLCAHVFEKSDASCEQRDRFYESFMVSRELSCSNNSFAPSLVSTYPVKDSADSTSIKCKFCPEEFDESRPKSVCCRCGSLMCSSHIATQENALQRVWRTMTFSEPAEVMCPHCSLAMSPSSSVVVEEVSTAAEIAVEISVSSPAVPSMLCALMDIRDVLAMRNDKVDTNNKVWIDWIVDRSSQHHCGCAAFVKERSASTKAESKKKDLEDKKRKARERALLAVKASAKAFVDLHDDVDAEDACSAAQDANSSDNSKISSLPICIVCRQSREANPDLSGDEILGYLCFAQLSSIYCSGSSTLHLGHDDHFTTNSMLPVLSTCGHAMHFDCYEKFMLSELSRPMQSMFVNDEKGQFQCPLCKKLGCCLLPCYEQCLSNPLNSESLTTEGNDSIRSSRSMADWPALTTILTDDLPNTSAPIGTIRVWDRFMISFGVAVKPAAASDPDILGMRMNMAREFAAAIAYKISATVIEEPRLISADGAAVSPDSSGGDHFLLRQIKSCYSCFSLASDRESFRRMLIEDLIRFRCCKSFLTSAVLAIGSNFQECSSDQQRNEILQMLKWICAAHLTHLVVLQMADANGIIDLKRCFQRSDAAAIKVFAVPEDVASLNALIAGFSRKCFDILGDEDESVTMAACSSTDLVDEDAVVVLDRITGDFIAFLKCVAKLCVLANILPESRARNEFELLDVLGFVVDVNIDKELARTMSDCWLKNANEFLLSNDQKTLISRRVPWIGGSCPSLVSLPKLYTAFHAEIMDKFACEAPGVCLHCGAVVSADGKGNCTTHVAQCSGSGGILFLLQDHSLLLISELHCCYYPSVYVDEHGETHKQYRGTQSPLLLNDTKYGQLQRLWLDHGIASEVAHQRASLPRVIIDGYY